MARKNRFRVPGFDLSKLGYHFWGGIAAWLFFLIIILYAGKMVYESNAFIIKEVKTNIPLSAATVSGIKGQSLFSFDAAALYLKIRKENCDLKDVFVTKHFPATISVVAVRRKPFIQIKANGFFTIDKEGVVIDDDPAPVINLLAVEISDCPKHLARGFKLLTPQFQLAVTLIDELKQRDFFARYSVELINTTSPKSAYFAVRNKNPVLGTVQVIIGNDDFARRLFIFDNMMATKIKGDLQLVKYIDLRYKKAYVGYKN